MNSTQLYEWLVHNEGIDEEDAKTLRGNRLKSTCNHVNLESTGMKSITLTID